MYKSMSDFEKYQDKTKYLGINAKIRKYRSKFDCVVGGIVRLMPCLQIILKTFIRNLECEFIKLQVKKKKSAASRFLKNAIAIFSERVARGPLFSSPAGGSRPPPPSVGRSERLLVPSVSLSTLFLHKQLPRAQHKTPDRVQSSGVFRKDCLSPGIKRDVITGDVSLAIIQSFTCTYTQKTRDNSDRCLTVRM